MNSRQRRKALRKFWGKDFYRSKNDRLNLLMELRVRDLITPALQEMTRIHIITEILRSTVSAPPDSMLYKFIPFKLDTECTQNKPI